MSEVRGSRRRFLGFCTEGVMAILSACVAVPAVAYVLAPLRRGPGKQTAGDGFLEAGPVDQLPMGQWRLVPLEVVRRDGWEESRSRHGVWVRRHKEAEGQIDVLSPICPHLGCPLNWHPDHAEFVCPCHGGVFSAEGAHLAGPPPRSMDPLEYRVENGRLLVRWQDFQIGLAERIPVRT